jgi:hypothetical protein
VSGNCQRNKLEPKISCFMLESSERSILVVLFIVEFAKVLIFGMVFEHRIDNTWKLLGSGTFYVIACVPKCYLRRPSSHPLGG